MAPVYRFDKSKFYPKGIIIDKKKGKRYVLELGMCNAKGEEKWLVILKNPSRAGEECLDISDKTVSTVGEFFYRKKRKVSELTIMNLFPVYETYSGELHKRKDDLVDDKNILLLKQYIKNADGIVLAWGAYPSKCKDKFECMKAIVYEYLKKSEKVYQMQKNGNELNLKRPMHGQVWGYDNYTLKKIKL